MAMTRKQRRSAMIAGGLVLLGVATFLVLTALRGSMVYFYNPSDVASNAVKPGQRFRLGGMVQEGSFKRQSGTDVTFEVTDGNRQVPVHYTGLLPDLFREGQGVVAEGALDAGGRFNADTVLAKHDEKYMPREVAESLKKSGRWQEGEATAQKPVQSKLQ
jgi:cytochrome c-type biogenesis protein CcmE